MKKILLYSGLVSLLFNIPITKIVAQPGFENIKLKGKLSPNTENEKNEADAGLKRLITPAAFQRQLSQPGNKKHVSELENGLQIVKDIINKLIGQEYSFSLLSQHKYMINDCLGLKVSAGEFSLRFNQPVVEIGAMGKIKIKLEVNKINFNALKVRMRPRVPDLQDPNPCHFSGKFEIGGEATDLTIKAEIDPVAQALTGGSPGFCFLAFTDDVIIKWNIGGLNLKPMQNNLDAMAKDMVEDALNCGMTNLFYTKFIEISRQVIPQYYAACEQAYAAGKDIINTLPSAITEEDANNGNSSSNESAKWVITAVPAMKGVLGRLNTKFPEGVEWAIDIRTTEDKFITNRSFVNKQDHHDLAPGMYYFRLNTITVQNVPVEKGKETRLKAGYLHIVSDGRWEIRNESKEKFHTSGNKPKKMALPIGRYQLKLGEQFFPIEIKDEEVLEM